MVVAIFRSRVRQEKAEEYYRLADQLAEIARTMPGFISWKGYTAEDGERVSIHEWASPETLAAWRNHPEHLRMQALGRERFYEAYTLYVCNTPRESRFLRNKPADV